jgi:hypothetical protein
MSRNRPETNRAAQAAHRARLKAAGYRQLLIALSPSAQRWLERHRGDRGRAQALSDLAEDHALKDLPIPERELHSPSASGSEQR